MRVAIVGAGIIGSSVARALARGGHKVVVFHHESLRSSGVSSHGRSRIVRRAYPDPFYTSIMTEAYPMWADLEAETGRKLINECGLIYFGRESGEMIEGARSAMESLGVPHHVLNKSSAATIPNSPILEPKEIALFVPQAGWVAADQALAAIQASAWSGGVSFVQMPVDSLSDLCHFDTFVLTPGSWIKKFLPIDVEVTLQTYAYIQGKGSNRGGPVWIHDNEHLTYGFPTEPGRTDFKMGIHRPGRVIDPDDFQREPSSGDAEIIRIEAQKVFGVDNPKLEIHTCAYTSTLDENFRIGQVERGLYISACSGHAFKMGPWLGELVKGLLEEKKSILDYPPFMGPSFATFERSRPPIFK